MQLQAWANPREEASVKVKGKPECCSIAWMSQTPFQTLHLQPHANHAVWTAGSPNVPLQAFALGGGRLKVNISPPSPMLPGRPHIPRQWVLDMHPNQIHIKTK